MHRIACVFALLSFAASAVAEEPKHVTTTVTTQTTTTQTTTDATETPTCDDENEKEHGACYEPEKSYDAVLGIRGSLMHVSGPQDATTAGAMFFLGSELYRTEGLLSLRSNAIAALGGGNGGVEGALGFGGTIGIRAPVTANQGPVARVGLDMDLLGNEQFYFSHIELPLGEIGYQYSNGATILEIGARGAPLLTGRYNTGDSFRRELGTSFEWGGYIGAHASIGRLDASFTRIEARSTPPDTPVDVARGSACVYAGKWVAICADAMVIHGDEQPPLAVPTAPPGATVSSSTTATSFYGGATLGFHW